MKQKSAADLLLVTLLAYAAASLLHHAHNAIFLTDYPNMPAWLSPARVWAAWLGITAVGLAGWLLYRGGRRIAGLIGLAGYAALGLYGLAHYRIAPLAAHTWDMHATIWLEVIGALSLLVAIAVSLARRAR